MRRFLFILLPWAVGVAVGLLLWDRIVLPFHNPLQVIGPLAQAQFNPANNLVRFAVFVGLPALLTGLTFLCLPAGRRRSIFPPQVRAAAKASVVVRRAPGLMTGRVPGLILLLLFAALVALNVPTYHASGPLDTFHEGESLGPAISWQADQAPYRDFVFVHGLWQDPLRAVAAWHLFGRSIGAVRALESATKVGMFLLLALFLFQVFRGRVLRALVALSVLALLRIAGLPGASELVIFPSRDILTLAFLNLVALLAQGMRQLDRNPDSAGPVSRGPIRLGALAALGAALGLVVSGAWAYSVDRALFLTLAWLILLALCLAWGWRERNARLAFAGGSALGILAGLGLCTWLLRGQWSALAGFVLQDFPRYKELIDGFAYPIEEPAWLLASLLAGANVLWLLHAWLHRQALASKPDWAAWIREHVLEIVLGCLALFFFRSPLGRADWEHVACALLPSYLLGLIILLRHWRLHLHAGGQRAGVALAIVLPALLAVDGVWNVVRQGLLAENFPVRNPDQNYVSAAYQEAVAVLRPEVARGARFYTLTNEAIWYYLLDTPCPTRFPVVWFAAPPAFQREIARDLERGRVRYLLLRNPHGANTIDRLPNAARLPVLFDYVQKHYRPWRLVAGQEIWIRVSE